MTQTNPNSQKATILLITDEHKTQIQSVYIDLFRRYGYSVITIQKNPTSAEIHNLINLSDEHFDIIVWVTTNRKINFLDVIIGAINCYRNNFIPLIFHSDDLFYSGPAKYRKIIRSIIPFNCHFVSLYDSIAKLLKIIKRALEKHDKWLEENIKKP